MADHRDIAGWVEHREGKRGGTSTVIFPGGSRAKFPASAVELGATLTIASVASHDARRAESRVDR